MLSTGDVRISLARVSELKSEDPGFDPPGGGQGEENVCMFPRVSSAADLSVLAPASCTSTHICAHETSYIYIYIYIYIY